LAGLGSATVSGTYPNFSINTPAPLTPSTGISINSGTITNTAPDQPVTILGLGATTIGGSYPNFTISSPVAVNPVITGQGTTTVTTLGNNYTVTTPPVNMSYTPGTGVLSYSPAAGSNTINISPTVSFAGSTLTVGSNSTVIPGSNLWARSSTTATTLFNTNDFLGIGTTSPTRHLQLLSSSNTELSIVAPATSKASVLFGTTANNTLGKIDYSNSTNVLSLWTNGISDRLAIDGSGRVGIGTSGPTENLQIQTSNTASLSLISTTGTAGILSFGHTGNHFMGAVRYDVSNNSMNFWTNNTADRMVIDASGRVGINNITPGYQLDVLGATANVLRLTNTTGSVKIDASPSATGELQIGSTGTGMTFVTGAAARMTINSAGNVGIGGMTTPLGRLDVFGGNTYFRPNAGNPNSFLVQDYIGTAMRLYTDASPGTPYDLILGTYPNGHLDQLFLKQSNGFVGVGTNNPTSQLHVAGAITIADGSEGAGKILMSNATGLATWQNPPPKVGFHAGTNPVTNQSIGASVVTTVQFGAGINFFNDGGAYNTSTYQFTPPSAGVYEMACHVSVSGPSGATLQVWISTPGGWVVRSAGSIPSSGSTIVSLSATVNSSVRPGPYYVQVVSNSAIQILSYDSSFSGHKVY
jgi:hypothetical protein